MRKMKGGEKKEKRAFLTVTIEESLLKKLREYCKEHQKVLSWFVEDSIRKNLANQSTDMK
jgi:hypothetical protein